MEIKLSSFWNSAQYHHGLVEFDSRFILPVAGPYVVYQPAYLDLCILCYVERCRPASRYDYSKPHGWPPEPHLREARVRGGFRTLHGDYLNRPHRAFLMTHWYFRLLIPEHLP